MINPNQTRLQWLRSTYIQFMKEGNDKFADYYRRLSDEQWATENPTCPLLRDYNKKD